MVRSLLRRFRSIVYVGILFVLALIFSAVLYSALHLICYFCVTRAHEVGSHEIHTRPHQQLNLPPFGLNLPTNSERTGYT